MGLRWLLCYEENHANVCHLQKAAPKHWFAAGQKIRVGQCPTRFGRLSWTTEAKSDHQWQVTLDLETPFTADLVIHIHPPNNQPLRHSTQGTIQNQSIHLTQQQLQNQTHLTLNIT
jgi:hypothetical protein